MLRGGFQSWIAREATTRAHARRSRSKRELTEERARRGYGRRSPNVRRKKIAHRVFERNERSYQMARPRYANHVNLWRRGLKIRFAFRSLSLIDDMAKRTGMSAIERLSNSLT